MQSRTRRNQVQNHSDRSSFDGEDRRATSNKRRKTESMDTLTKRPEGMYRFPQVIDLTGSQPGESAALPTRRVGSTVRPTSSMQTGTKKLVVKNLRSAPSSEPSRYYDHVWTQLSEALDAIFSHDTKQYSMEELYRGVENICRQEKAAALFNGLESRCREHVSETIRGSLIGAAQHSTDKQTLGLVIEAWATWKRHVVCKSKSGCSNTRSYSGRQRYARFSFTWIGPTCYTRLQSLRSKNSDLTCFENLSFATPCFGQKYSMVHVDCYPRTVDRT